MSTQLTELLYLIHPKTFKVIEEHLNSQELIIAENLQGQIIKLGVKNAPYHLLIFFLDSEVALRFITDNSAVNEGIFPDLEINLSHFDIHSLFLVNFDDFFIYKLNTIELTGNKKIFMNFKKFIDKFYNDPLQTLFLFQKITSALNIEPERVLKLIEITNNLKNEELNIINNFKNMLKTFKEKKINDLASFSDNFQTTSQRLGLLEKRLVGLQSRQLIFNSKLEIFFKRLKTE